MEFQSKTFLSLCSFSRCGGALFPSTIGTGLKSSSTINSGLVGEVGVLLVLSSFPAPALYWVEKWNESKDQAISSKFEVTYGKWQNPIQTCNHKNKSLLNTYWGLVDMKSQNSKGLWIRKSSLKSVLQISPISFFPLCPVLCGFLSSRLLNLSQNSCPALSKLDMHIPFVFANPFLGIYTPDILTQVCKNKRRKIFEKTQGQSKCPPIRDYLNKLHFIYSMI